MGRPFDNGGGSFSGIDPQRLHELINSLERHARCDGPGAHLLVRGWTARAAGIGLDTRSLTRVTRHLSWAQDQLPILRQRLFLARHADQPYLDSRAMVRIDDALVDGSPPAEVRRDAAEAAALTRSDPSHLTAEPLARLALLLEQHGGNPYFAEHFATRGGAAAPLAFYASLADPRRFRLDPRDHAGPSPELRSRQRLVRRLATSLGTTLGTASRLDTPALRQWQRDVIALGGTDLGDGGQYRVYGFQAMSALLRYGTYGTGFLTHYGTALLAFERAHTHDVLGGLQRRVAQRHVLPWEQPGTGLVRLHYGAGNDAGADPLTGYLEALGNNASAATAFFQDAAAFSYLLEQRVWPRDFASSSATTVFGHTALGRALESAALGCPVTAAPPRLRRTRAAAAVVLHLVTLFGRAAAGTATTRTAPSGTTILAHHPGLTPSLARITAAYIDDVDWGLDGPDNFSLFANSHAKRARDDRALFDTANLQRFLGTIGRDDDAYRIVTNAQQAYTTSLLNAYPPRLDSDGQVKSSDTESVVRIGAQLQGIMDRAWVDQYKADGDQKDQKFNERLDKRAERQQMITALVTGGIFAFAPEPEEGFRATVVPLVTEDTQDWIDEQIGQNIEDYAESQHRNLSDVRQGKASDVYAAGRLASWIPVSQLLNARHVNGWSPGQLRQLDESLKQAQETGYSTGSLTQEQGGNLPVTG